MSNALLSLSLYQNLPPPADDRAAEIGLARWHEAADDVDDPGLVARLRELAATEPGLRLLRSIFGNSPYLTQSCLREPAFLLQLLERGPDATFAEVLRRLNHEVVPDMARPTVMAALRVAKRRAALLIALADLAGHWTLEKTTGALSDLAETALGLAVDHLLASAEASGDRAPGDRAENGLIVLGMGKLGARELNYSSDIDLILLFDAERSHYTGKRGFQPFFTGLAHDLVRIMAERTAEGYVFRTDLRLRPDPGSTPPAVAVPAALAYYESAGQNWERAALIKARPVAGDRVAGRAFLAELQPFLWRKNLDFAAIQDIHSIKRQINAHRGGTRIAVEGHDIKLGRGGIREIEFFAQTQQLIWGGRRPGLRCAGTLDALYALATSGLISAEARDTMSKAYHFLRRLEHRLQMIDDAQTHSVPRDPASLHRVAVLMGLGSAEALAAALTAQLAAVEAIYSHLFEEEPSLAAPGNLVFTGAENDPETLRTIEKLGFAEPARIAAIIRAWHHGRYRSMRSQRARELLTELVPALLSSFGAAPNPDIAFLRFDEFLARLPAGVPLLSLLYNNPTVLGLVAEIMGASTRLADALARRPALLDAILSDTFFEPPPPREELASELRDHLGRAAHYEDLLDITRRWVGERRFQVGVQLLRHWFDGEKAGAAFADIAETAIGEILPRVTAEFARIHGTVPQGSFIVLGLGKLGSREMTVTSDLDLILIYDAPDTVEASDGARPLPVATYYARLCQRFINALTAQTSEGGLYEVDMRLRPSGNAGPVATSLAAFRRYQHQDAWTWEHMALTRARIIAGAAPLAAQVRDEIRAILTQPRDAGALVRDVDDMRRRIAEEHRHSDFWDVKHRLGGMVDIEFITQYLQLREASARPALLQPNTLAALQALEEAGVLTPAAGHALRHALGLWRNVQSLLKLIAEEPFAENDASISLKSILAKGAGAIDFAGLKADMEAAARQARGQYDALVAVPAAQARRAAPPPINNGG